MKEYEIMYIVPTSYTEEELGAVEKNVAEALEKHQAKTIKSTRLGKLRFAYPIRSERFGHYILLRIEVEPVMISGIEQSFRLNQKEILRHLVVCAEDVSAEFNLVQFQEVHVESMDRRKRPMKTEKGEEKEKDEKEQKEGVAALEGTDETGPTEKKDGIEELSAEDLQKKIDEALEEKA